MSQNTQGLLFQNCFACGFSTIWEKDRCGRCFRLAYKKPEIIEDKNTYNIGDAELTNQGKTNELDNKQY